MLRYFDSVNFNNQSIVQTHYHYMFIFKNIVLRPLFITQLT